jgi:hypothetical protein
MMGRKAAFELQIEQGATTTLLSAATAIHRFVKLYLEMLLKMTMLDPRQPFWTSLALGASDQCKVDHQLLFYDSP